eukprot:COSAG02_NODE_81232_length_105_cov_63.833333_1_plen_34_part_11
MLKCQSELDYKITTFLKQRRYCVDLTCPIEEPGV